MAFLSVTLQDDYGRLTRRRYEMDEQSTLADYITAATSFIGALEDVTDLGAIRVDLVLEAIVSGFAETAGANVDVGATFTGNVYGGNGKRASMKLPGIKMSKVDPDGSVPLTGDIGTWLAEFENGEDFMLSDGEQIDAWVRGVLDK